MMQFKVYDTKYARRLYFLGDFEVQFTDHEAVVPTEVAYRMRNDPGSEFVLEKKRIPFTADSWARDRRLIWKCNVSSANGYGMVAENTVKSLVSLGVNAELAGAVSGNWISGGEFVDPNVITAIKEVIYPDCLEIQHCQPPALRLNVAERIWAYTMFETSHTPASWIKILNQTDHVLVPARWLVDSWKEQGLTRPIDVYGHGIDPSVYHELTRPTRDTFTFLHYSQLSLRKGTDLVYRAFVDEFRGVDDAKLILKNIYPLFPVPFNTPNVEYIHATYSKEQMRDLLQRADCFLFPTRGEGFGLPALEAMATGLPAVVTGWSGPADYTDPDDTLILSYTMKRSVEFDKIYHDFFSGDENAGDWAEPSYEQLRGYMRFCYENRDKARDMGHRAAQRIAKSWTWTAKAAELVDVIGRGI